MARSRRLALVLTGLLVLVGLIASVPAASARTSLDAVAASLRSDPVYNDPTAENALTPSQADDLRSQIRATGVPIYIAILPASAATENGGADQLLVNLKNAVAREGVYAIVAGNAFRAGSTSGTVKDLADQAFASQKGNGPYAVLSDFVAGVGDRFGSGGSSGGGSSGGGGGGWILLIVLVVILGGLGALIFFGVRASRKRRAQQLEHVKAALDEDVTSLGEQLAAFDISDPRLDDAGRADLQKALDSYSRASDASARARSDADVTAVTGNLEDGRYALACVQARMAGQALPQRRPPCFVDPRHGPSTADIMWAPQGGPPHAVPVCTACAQTIQAGGTPQAREVTYAGQQVPYWQAGPEYAPYARGYYSSFGDILPALFIGTMMANAFSPPVIINSGVDQAGFGGGGGFGGGNFGGGDFGGGGFGGGDFGGGGGGFGGGDFGN